MINSGLMVPSRRSTRLRKPKYSQEEYSFDSPADGHNVKEKENVDTDPYYKGMNNVKEIKDKSMTLTPPKKFEALPTNVMAKQDDKTPNGSFEFNSSIRKGSIDIFTR